MGYTLHYSSELQLSRSLCGSVKKTMMNTTMNSKKKLNPGAGGGGSTSTPPGPPDRISELPVEILHRILGFLDMDEFLIRTSLVSTHWRNLWKSVPVLKFYRRGIRRRIDDGSSVDNDDDDDGIITNNPEKYHNFMHHVLRLRGDSQASSIRIFKYYCDAYSKLGYDYLERLHNFIVSAVVNQGAEEIEIRGSYSGRGGNNNNMIHFNPSIFTSRVLRVFNFNVFNHHFQIQFPRSMCCCATQLTYLSLYNIRLPEGDESNAQLHLVCPLLERLVMSNCSSEHLKVLDISAPRLDTLSICNYTCMRLGGSDFLGGCRIEIRTPNLTSLAYKGRVYVDCFTVNLPLIADASLKISEEPGMVEKTTSFAIKLLKELTSAESLILEGFEVFSQDTLKVILTPFTSLRTLELVSSCKISSIRGMVHILNGCNSIEKLVWDVDRYYYYYTVKSDEHLMLPQCRLSHLKHVHIKYLRGHENQIEFVKFLLKSSVVLEDLIITTTKNSPKRLLIEENLKQFIEEKPSVRRSIKLYVLEEEES